MLGCGYSLPYDMKKVVLLAINAKYVHSALPVWLLAGGVLKFARLPYDVEIVEATVQQSIFDIAAKVTAHGADVVGISTYIWNACKLLGLLKILREWLPRAVFVLGGPEASHNAEYWLNNGADHVVCGEGERSFPVLLDSLDSSGASQLVAGKQTTQGLARMESVQPEQAQPEPAKPVQAQPDPTPIDPYTDAYFEALGDRIAYLETSRGCTFQCAFCLSGGTGVKFFPLETAKERIYKLSQSGVRTIKLVDRTFNCDAGRAYDLFEYIIRLDTPCRFHFEVAPDLFDERTLKLLASAPPGRIQLEAGLQSFFEPALKASFRHTKPEIAKSNIRALVSNQNIHIHIDLIAGLPYETLPVFMDSFDIAYALGAHTLQLGFLKLLHGSALRARAEALGIRYSAAPPYEITDSAWLSVEDIKALKLTENALKHTYNKMRFLSAIEYVLSASGIRPFLLYHALGTDAPNHGTHLDRYAVQVHDCFSKLPGVDEGELRERMICDWLGMVKGKNMPQVMKTPDRRRGDVADVARKLLGHTICRDELAFLPSGGFAVADSGTRDAVTGLYKVLLSDMNMSHVSPV